MQPKNRVYSKTLYVWSNKFTQAAKISHWVIDWLSDYLWDQLIALKGSSNKKLIIFELQEFEISE